jgi:hypothetical protein
MVKKIATRIEALEAELKEPPRRICKVCGAEGGGKFIEEEHHEDGTVVYDRRPCPGCVEVAPPGRVITICVHRHDCWCENSEEKVEAAPKVYLDEADEATFEKYASGAAKYHRRLGEEQQRKEA